MAEEGGIRLNLTINDTPRRKDGVFYNPRMKANRDVSLGVVGVLLRERASKGRDLVRVCDVLAASGVRGMRWKRAFGGKVEVHLCERKNEAVEQIGRLLELNKLSCDVHHGDAVQLLREKSFDYLDVDPFGSPVGFLDAATQAVHHSGILAVTATDLAPLSGTYPKAGLRKYAARSLRAENYHELGLRILIKSIIESAGRDDRGFQVLLAYYKDHYFRVYGRVMKGAGRANRAFSQISYYSHCFSCGWRAYGRFPSRVCSDCGKDVSYAGPLYSGPLTDAGFVGDVIEEVRKMEYQKVVDFLELVNGECDVALPYYDIHAFGKRLKKVIPKRKNIIRAIERMKYRAVPTHFSGTGIRTDMPIKGLLDVLRVLGEEGG